MKARIVLAGLLVSMMVVEVSAQGAEYDDMYFRGKDRERNKAIDAEEAISAKTKKQSDEVAPQEDDNSNPTDTYSARNVNPEYVSRSNSEKASEDESNYYLEGYTPASSNSNFANSDFNNSYYNNANWAGNSFYGSRNDNFFNRGYGCNYCSPQMSWMITSAPYYPFGYYDSWMSPYGYGPSYGWRTGWSASFMYGGYGGMYNPYYGGYGNPYYGGGYPGYYNGGNGNYYEAPRVVNTGKRPSRHSAVVQPTQRTETRTRNAVAGNVANVNSNTNVNSGSRPRQRQVQEDYYVRPSRRPSTTSTFDTPNPWNSNSGGAGNGFSIPTTQPSRTRDTYNPPSTPSPSYTPSSSPSRGGSGGSGSGGGGGSSPRPRGGRD